MVLFKRTSPILVSVLLPTRHRKEVLLKSINSLVTNADVPSRIELLLRIDEDDVDTISVIQELPSEIISRVIIGPTGRGYTDLHIYYNELAKLARGDWLLIFNDDAIIESEHWDTLLAALSEPGPISKKFVLSDDEITLIPTGDFSFPFVPKKAYDILGYLSLIAPVDWYICKILWQHRIKKHFPIKITHYRETINDSLYFDSEKQMADARVQGDSEYLKRRLQVDRTKINTYLAAKATGIQCPDFRPLTMQDKQIPGLCDSLDTLPGKDIYDLGQLRYADEIPALSYAHGCVSFNCPKSLFGFTKIGKTLEPRIPAKAQVNRIKQIASRTPKNVLDIGAGRGTTSLAFAYAGATVQSVEPATNFYTVLHRTAEHLSIDCDNISVINKDIASAVGNIEWEGIDTAVMVSSVWCITREDLDVVLPMIKRSLKKNNGLLIITDSLRRHPILITIGKHPDQYVTAVQTSFYHWLAEEGEIRYHRGSHLVVQF